MDDLRASQRERQPRHSSRGTPPSGSGPSDRLYFYSGSADLPPGEGVHEVVAEAAAYRELAQVAHWRRMLSNFWPAAFTLGDRTYRTVEHAFQAAKIALVEPSLAAGFALESGTALARGGGAEARKQRKLVLLDEAQLQEWDRRKHGVMREAMHAKFGQHPDLRAVLAATSPAELWHGAGRGQAPQRMLDLEAIRKALGAG
jgi:ribA/ribD-fused uncharacterized protein